MFSIWATHFYPRCLVFMLLENQILNGIGMELDVGSVLDEVGRCECAGWERL